MTDLQTYMYDAVLNKDYLKLTMQPPRKVEDDDDDDSGATKRKRRACTINKRNTYTEKELDDFTPNVEPEEIIYKSTIITTPEHVPFEMQKHTYQCNILMQNPLMMLRKIVNHPFTVWRAFDTKTRRLITTEDILLYSGKMKILDVFIPMLISRGHRMLLFSGFVTSLDMIEELLMLRGYNYCRLDGERSYTDRNENIGDFQENDDIPIFLLSTKAGGLGLNLTQADTVIFFDRDWNPMNDVQAQDRCHRIGQTKPVVVYSLVCKNTVDERILEVSTTKRRLEKMVLKEGEFETQMRKPQINIEQELLYLEELFRREKESVQKVHSNGLVYSKKELAQIIDRSDLYDAMKELNKENNI